MSDIYMKGTQSPKASRVTKQFAKGRVCEKDGCEQTLSIYNDKKNCSQHTPKKPPRIRGREDPRVKYYSE